MNKFVLNNFYPFQGKGNCLGFAGLTVTVIVDNQPIALAIKVKVMRNSTNGHVFLELPSEKYTAKDGTEKYSHLIHVQKEHFLTFQKNCTKAWDEYVASKEPTANPSSSTPQKQYYPHGLCGTLPYKEVDLPNMPDLPPPRDEEPF